MPPAVLVTLGFPLPPGPEPTQWSTPITIVSIWFLAELGWAFGWMNLGDEQFQETGDVDFSNWPFAGGAICRQGHDDNRIALSDRLSSQVPQLG